MIEPSLTATTPPGLPGWGPRVGLLTHFSLTFCKETHPMPPQTIDDVLIELDQIILRARNERSRLGFFPTLYRNVTIRVKEGIAAGAFEDGARMEKLDVTFANGLPRRARRFSQRETVEEVLAGFVSNGGEVAADHPPAFADRHECAHQFRSGHCGASRCAGSGTRFTGT